MDATHLHLVLNHFPIVGTFFAMFILAFGLFLKKDEVANTALIMMIFVAIITIPVYVTGEEAEHTVEYLPGVSKYYIEEHEKMGELSLWLVSASGTVAVMALLSAFLNKKRNKTLDWATLGLLIGTFAFMAYVGDLGGKIRHSEIRKVESHPTRGQD
ncbi:MAG: hypothetical protein AAFX87_17805 [Bacteroidota bacterium]